MPDAVSIVHQLIDRIGAKGHRLLPEVTARFARYWQADTFAARPNPHQRVNRYQADLQKAYTDWYEETADDLSGTEDDDAKDEIIAAALLALLALLKKMGRENLPDAVDLALGGGASFPELDGLLDDQIEENEKYLTTSLIPDLKSALASVAAGASAEAIIGTLSGFTTRVGSYGGEWWSLYNESVGLVSKKSGKKVVVYLDEQAKHCGECPNFGSVDGKEYESWDAYMESTGGRVPGDFECGPNCRCTVQMV